MLIIRNATTEDIPEIRELFQQTIFSVNIKDYTPEQLHHWADRGKDASVWEERISEQYFIVAEINSLIVGFSALKPDGYLNSLFVHKDYQDQAIASTLLNHMEAYSAQHKIREITADVSITAKPFFSKKGYTVLQEQTVNIGVDMTNFKMKKIL